VIARATTADPAEAPRLTRERKRLTSVATSFVPSEDPGLDAKRLADAGAFFRRLGTEAKP
jgi:hypothetical protein